MFKESASDEEKQQGFFKYFNKKVKDDDFVSEISQNTSDVEQIYIKGKYIYIYL